MEQEHNHTNSQHQKENLILLNGNPQDIAQLIAESSSALHRQSLIKEVKKSSDVRWQEVRNELKNMLVVNPQRMYTSNNFLSKDKLLLIRDVFKEEQAVDQIFFQNESGFLLLAVAAGFLERQPQNQQLLKLKQLFAKNIKKQSNFWGFSQLQALQNYIIDPTTGYFPTFSATQHQLELDRFQFFLQFSLNHPTMFPHNTDLGSIMFKMMLCLRQQKNRDKSLLTRLKQQYFESKYHFQTTLKNMKFALQFLRNNFNDKQCLYYPQRAINSLLDKYSQEQIQNLLEGSWLGLQWSTEAIYNYFTACIKLGITQTTTKMMIAMIKFCEKHQKYNELLYNYENNLSRLFIFLKYPKLYSYSSELLKYFIYSPTPQTTLYQKFVEKAIPLATTIAPQILYPFLNILQTVAFIYKDTTTVNDLTTIIDSLIGEGVNRLTEQQIKLQTSQYNWKIKVKGKLVNPLVQKQPGYRGMTNIGNSCYLNSFLQSLFMNREFTRSILSVSTLQLQKQRLKEQNLPAKDPVALSKLIRQDLRPLAELQRIFALLLTSKRSEITPLPIRNISPPQFRNNLQHDTLQFGRIFLDLLYRNKIVKLFEGETITAIECQACRGIRQRKEVFLDLMVTPQKDQEQLAQSLQNAFSDEIIHDLVCDYCGERRDNSVKRHFLSKMPNYLIVSVKRFQYSVTEQKNSKIMSKVIIRPTIDIKEEPYDLYSIIVHRGPSPNAGHYFSFSKLNYQPASKWLCHNDSEVSQLQNYQEVINFLDNNDSDTPYILFFQRRNYITAMKQELTKPIALRKPLEEYVQRDNLQQQKSKQKKLLPIYNPFNFGQFFKKDDDDEDGGSQNQPFYTNYVL